MEQRRESEELEKKVRIKLKTDPKQDPKLVKAEGKSALKKDQTPSPDGVPSQQRDSQQSSSSETSEKRSSKRNSHTENEAKKNKSKDDAEKLEDAKKNVVDHNTRFSNLKEVAEQEKPADSVVREDTSSPKSNVMPPPSHTENEAKKNKSKDDAKKLADAKENVGGRNIRFSSLKEVAEQETPTDSFVREDTSSTKLNVISSPSHTENEAKKNKSNDYAEKQEQDDAEKLVDAKENVVDRNRRFSSLKEQEAPTDSFVRDDTSSPKSNIISPPSKPDAVKEEGKFSKDEVSSQEGVSGISNDDVSVIKGENVSEPLSSNKEKYLVGTSNNENQSSDETKTAITSGNDHYEPNDDPNRGNETSEAKTSDENEIIVSSVHNDDNDVGDTPSTKISIKVRKKTNEDLEQSAVDGKSENNEATGEHQMSTDNHEIRYSDISTTSNSNNEMLQASRLQSANVEEESTTAKETPIRGMKTNSFAETQDNIGNKLHEDENSAVKGTKDLVKNEPDERKDENDGNDGSRIPLERTSRSEDLKINELKKRVRPGNVFVVKGDPDCYTVKWAEKRKILAYKVGSKNTSRFSTVLIETVEQLERASVRHPSIISELTHPITGAKGSLLSTYFAGADARRSIKDNLIREAGTNTDDQNGLESREQSPDFFAKDHISPDGEVFGGVTPNQPTTADPIIQSNNYNYPFLTDYDVNHDRKGDK